MVSYQTSTEKSSSIQYPVSDSFLDHQCGMIRFFVRGRFAGKFLFVPVFGESITATCKMLRSIEKALFDYPTAQQISSNRELLTIFIVEHLIRSFSKACIGHKSSYTYFECKFIPSMIGVNTVLSAHGSDVRVLNIKSSTCHHRSIAALKLSIFPDVLAMKVDNERKAILRVNRQRKLALINIVRKQRGLAKSAGTREDS